MAQATTTRTTTPPTVATFAGPTIADLRDEWESSLRSAHRRDETIRTYLEAIKQFDAFLAAQGMPRAVASITREHCEAFIVHLLATKSASTAKTRFGALKTFWRYVIEDAGEADRNPMERMKAPTVDEADTPVPDADALRRLLATCGGRTFDDRRDQALLRLAADTGLRRGELAALTLGDLDVRAQVVHVRAASSKSRRNRRVPFGPTTATKLAQYLRMRAQHPKARGVDSLREGDPRRGALWLGKLGPLGGAGILQMLHRRCDEAGIERLHPHQLRHFFAHASKNGRGLSDEELMRLGGWRSHAMVARYGRAQAEERAIAAYRAAGPSPADDL